jgi:hypothetical protein
MMNIDPHTLQQILQRIYQQMRCPQCSKRVPVDFSSVRVMAESTLLLQLKCESCNAYIVLQASLQGVEEISVQPYEDDVTTNVSSGLDTATRASAEVGEALKDADGSFEKLFEKFSKESKKAS